MLSEKYGHTYHYPLSPGTMSNDRINHTYWEDIREVNTLVHTEELDGENNCLSGYGVSAYSYAASTTSPRTGQLRQHQELLRNNLRDIELFGENLYAVHSIEYERLEIHFYTFAARCLNKRSSWEEVEFCAASRDLPTVPELCTEQINGLTTKTLKQYVICLAREPSAFESHDALTGIDCTHEGVVTRNAGECLTADFVRNTFEHVRQGYVRTDERWTRHRKRTRLAWESKRGKGGDE